MFSLKTVLNTVIIYISLFRLNGDANLSQLRNQQSSKELSHVQHFSLQAVLSHDPVLSCWFSDQKAGNRSAAGYFWGIWVT